jgi:hypothetical protein
MPVDINVSVDLVQFRRELKEFEDQIPYAISTAINDVAKKAQVDIRAHINESFTVRRKQWVDNSVKIKPFATKQNLQATIAIDPAGGRSDILSKFEYGGTKTSTTGGLVAIPGDDIRPDRHKVIPSGKRPKNLKNAFILKTRSGGEALMTYIGRGKSRVLKLAYLLVKSVPIRNNLEFASTAIKTVNREWETSWNAAWKKAIDSAFR